MNHVYEELNNATPEEVAAYLHGCLAAKEDGATPQEIAGYITALLGHDNPFEWYRRARYRSLNEILDLASDLEIGNVGLSDGVELGIIGRLVDDFQEEIQR